MPAVRGTSKGTAKHQGRPEMRQMHKGRQMHDTAPQVNARQREMELTGFHVHAVIRCGDIMRENCVDDGCIARHMCNDCRNGETHDGINAVGCKVAMRRYHIVIEEYPTETVIAKDMQDAFMKSSFYMCETDRMHYLLIYEALDSEPDYSAANVGFCPDEARNPVSRQSFTINSKTHGVKNNA